VKVLILSRNYPNAVMPRAGIWVEGLVRALDRICDLRVVSPLPYCPPLPRFVAQSRLRDIPRRDRIHGIDVRYPRFAAGPGYSLHNYEADTYFWGARGEVDRLRREFPFDLIHAHFSYPDGVAAARLARRYGVPLLITEHAPWLPWMEQYPRVRRQAVWASRQCAFHMGVSQYVRDTITRFTGPAENLRVVPVGVDGATFRPEPGGGAPDPNLIVYAGRIHPIKGVDVLLQAMLQVVARRPEARLILVGGGSFFRGYRLREERLRAMAAELGLGRHAEFIGERPPDKVARLMGQSAVVVLPSRAESFGAVLVEALACGTPVVATRCGGSEDIVTERVGLLIDKECPDVLAAAIERVLDRRSDYDPAELRAHALDNFSWDGIARRTLDLYGAALTGCSGR
jgi:glycosyltransferase involved in cell wall biosynthesis